MKGTKLEEQAQNFNKNMRNYETKSFFSFAKQLETTYFVFRETIETRQNSDLFRTVSYFANLKQNTKLSTLLLRPLWMHRKGRPNIRSDTRYEKSLDIRPNTQQTLF